MLKEFGYPSQIDDLVEEIRDTDYSTLDKGVLFEVRYYETDYVVDIFGLTYRIILSFFLLGFFYNCQY